MHFTVEIPDDVAEQLNAAASGDLARRALEAFALDEYRNGHLPESALRRMLGLTRYELDGFLKAHGIWIDFTAEDLRREVSTLERLGF